MKDSSISIQLMSTSYQMIYVKSREDFVSYIMGKEEFMFHDGESRYFLVFPDLICKITEVSYNDNFGYGFAIASGILGTEFEAKEVSVSESLLWLKSTGFAIIPMILLNSDSRNMFFIGDEVYEEETDCYYINEDYDINRSAYEKMESSNVVVYDDRVEFSYGVYNSYKVTLEKAIDGTIVLKINDFVDFTQTSSV